MKKRNILWISTGIIMILAIMLVLTYSCKAPAPATITTPIPDDVALFGPDVAPIPAPPSIPIATPSPAPTPDDTTPPTVSSTLPANADAGVDINSAVTAVFSEALDPLTVTNATFTLKQGETPVSGTVTYDGVTATFMPEVILAAGTDYTAMMSTGVKDLALVGNAMAVNYTWNFTTYNGGDVVTPIDTKAPTVNSTIPVNTATGVAVNSAMSATFSEAMDPLTVTNATFTLKQGATPVSGTVTYDGVTATFIPEVILAAGTNYTAMMSTGVKDLALVGNAMAGNYTWNFTTYNGGGVVTAIDTTAPTVSSTFPVNTDWGVAVNSAMSATFSEAMDPLTITNVTFTLSRGVTPISGAVTYSGVTGTFNPDVDLAPGTNYTATISTGVKDVAGNVMVVNKEWAFTTTGGGGGRGGGGGGTPPADLTAPTVSSTIPVNTATGVAVNSAMSATFSEAMDPLTVTNVTFTLTQGVTPISGAVTYAGVTGTFTPTANLTASTTYTATITTGVKDLAGNALAVNKVWTFTTSITLAANPTAPSLGELARFAILTSQTITTTPGSHISNGDMGIMDLARTFYTGFTVGVNPGEFVELTNGLSYAHSDTDPALTAGYASTIDFLNQVRTDLTNAYNFLAAVTNPTAPLIASPSQLGGLTLTRGFYWTSADILITAGTLRLDAQGDPNSVWIISTTGTLTIGDPSGAIQLANGAQAKNVYFRSAGETVIGTGRTFYGNVFAASQVRVLTGANVTGRLFGKTAQVTLDAATVTKAP